jgi:prophage antirepressor-like protein
VSELVRATVHSFSFDNKSIRTFDVGGHRLAVGADICAALAIKNSRASLAKLEVDDKLTLHRSDTVSSTDGIWDQFAPQVQTVVLVTEDGATELVLESRKPEARAFRKWMTHEVWPSIRKTGGYSAAPALPQDYSSALRALADEVDARKVAEAKAIEARREIAVLEPKGKVFDQVMNCEEAYSFAAAAAEVGWTRNLMTRELRAQHVLKDKPKAEHNTPYAEFLQYFFVEPTAWDNPKNGEKVPSRTTRVRRSSIPWLHDRLTTHLGHRPS